MIIISFELATRLTEVLLGIAFAQQSLEHLYRFTDERVLFSFRLVFSVLLIIGFQSDWILVLLIILSIFILYRFNGPYNGGADRMGLLILFCVGLSQHATTQYWQEIAFGYLAIQLMLSYFMSGYVKLKNPNWRNGQALVDVFQFSAYPVTESLRHWAKSPKILFLASWMVIVFEIIFPFSLVSNIALIIALLIATGFHLANAFIFGLNRFFWIWIAAYPSILWLQQRLIITS